MHAAILPRSVRAFRTGRAWRVVGDGGTGDMEQLEERSLPGIGLRHDFQTRTGRRVGVVAHRDDTRELVFYRPDDPDAVASSVPSRPRSRTPWPSCWGPRASSSSCSR
ncbi:MAG: hypothetical protein M3P95_12395 [Actinomycetota bacterium]|nr:hypothetical protein [Actinomycetota bacterium]